MAPAVSSLAPVLVAQPSPYTPMRQSLAAACADLTAASAWLEPAATPPMASPSSPPQVATFAALTGPAQYTRTHIQGCVCKSSLVVGGCCPGTAAGALAHAGPGGFVMDAVGGALGIVGLYAGFRGAQLARDGLHYVNQVDSWWTVRHQRARDTLRDLDHAEMVAHGRRGPCCRQRQPFLPAARAHNLQRADAAQGILQALHQSRREQMFNLRVPGCLQAIVAGTRTVAVAQHLAARALGIACSTAMGTLAGALFTAYGAVMAVKDAAAWMQSRAVPARTAADLSVVAPPEDPALGDAYAAAVEHYRRGRQHHYLRHALAWSAVVASTSLGVVAGVTGLAALWPWIAVATLVSAAWAIGESTSSRYAPHVPVSPHLAPETVATSTQRARTWRQLERQQAGIATAIHTVYAAQPWSVRVLYRLEHTFMPHCGPSAFSVLPRRIAQASGSAEGERYQRAQLAAALTYARAERQLRGLRWHDNQSTLHTRHAELQGWVGDSGSLPQRPNLDFASVLTHLAEELRDDARTHHDDARTVARLDALVTQLDALQRSKTPLTSTNADGSATPWTHARLLLLQIQGTLTDAIRPAFYARHRDMFTHATHADTLPIPTVQVRADSADNFVRAIAPELDRMFPHAFMNPRRTATEMDVLCDRELAPLAATDRAPSAALQTCCT